jgi:hypothetical protein
MYKHMNITWGIAKSVGGCVYERKIGGEGESMREKKYVGVLRSHFLCPGVDV